jgi:hypothetical protein
MRTRYGTRHGWRSSLGVPGSSISATPRHKPVCQRPGQQTAAGPGPAGWVGVGGTVAGTDGQVTGGFAGVDSSDGAERPAAGRSGRGGGIGRGWTGCGRCEGSGRAFGSSGMRTPLVAVVFAEAMKRDVQTVCTFGVRCAERARILRARV